MIEGSSARSRAPGGRELALVAVVALALRLGAMAVLDTPAAADGASAWSWGAEAACLAESLAQGEGLADPWELDSGPSAWLTPVFPGLLALLMSLFGGVSRATATALFTIQSLADALTCVLVARLAVGLGLARVARVAAWLWAVYPLAVWNAVQSVWDTTLVAFALTLFLSRLFAPGREEGAAASPGRALRLGLGYGAVLLLNPAPLGILPVIAWEVMGTRLRGSGLRALAVFGAAALAVCLPWMIRNQVVVGSPALRPVLGIQFLIGNHEEAIGWPEFGLYHYRDPVELARFRELGEVPYSADCGRRAREWIAEHPGSFVRLSLHRMQLYWLSEPPLCDERTSSGGNPAEDPLSWVKYACYLAVGVLGAIGALRARLSLRRRLVLLTLPVLFGAPYYLTIVSERFRFPLDPLLVLLTAALLLRLRERRRAAESGA